MEIFLLKKNFKIFQEKYVESVFFKVLTLKKSINRKANDMENNQKTLFTKNRGKAQVGSQLCQSHHDKGNFSPELF